MVSCPRRISARMPRVQLLGALVSFVLDVGLGNPPCSDRLLRCCTPPFVLLCVRFLFLSGKINKPVHLRSYPNPNPSQLHIGTGDQQISDYAVVMKSSLITKKGAPAPMTPADNRPFTNTACNTNQKPVSALIACGASIAAPGAPVFNDTKNSSEKSPTLMDAGEIMPDPRYTSDKSPTPVGQSADCDVSMPSPPSKRR